MFEFTRKMIKNDHVMRGLLKAILKYHKVAKHTEEVLRDNKHVKDFCEEARRFATFPGRNDIHIHYDVSTWFKKPDGIVLRVEAITVYDNLIEFEVARQKQLNAAEVKDYPESN